MDSDLGFKCPYIPVSAEIVGYMFEPPPYEPVNQPDSDDEGADIRSSTGELSVHCGRNPHEHSTCDITSDWRRE